MRKIKSSKKSRAKIKISACYIVKNEEDNLKRSIESLRSAMDEIIVVDTGSTDGTIEIAKSYGAKIIEVPWEDDFSKPRNKAIEAAEGDWIIFLDADEFFAFPDKVRPAIEALIKDTEAIIIPRINIDKDNGNQEINRNLDLRIFRNTDYLRYRGMIHENIENIKGGNFAHVLGGDDLTIYHTGYSTTLHRDKYLRNLRILELEIKNYGYRVQQDMSYANCYAGLGDYEKALIYAKKAAKNYKEIITNPEAPFIHILKAMYELKYPFEEILGAVNEAIKALPNIPLFYDQQGILLSKLNRPEEANISFNMRDIAKIKIDIENNGHKPQHDAELSSCYFGARDYEKSINFAKKAIKAGLKLETLYQNIIHAMYRLGYPEDKLLKVIHEAIKVFPKSDTFKSMIR